MPGPLTRPSRLLPRGALDALLQVVVVLAAYEAYRLSRGAADGPGAAATALSHARWIIDLERTLHLDPERGLQAFAEWVPGLADVSSFLYINVQTTVTFSALAYIYARHTDAFNFVRNMFLMTWGLSILGFVLLPVMPPRLVPDFGLHDSVAAFTGIDPSERKVTRFYNPYAAMPSLHVGVAVMVGLSLSRLARHGPVRVFWAGYPLLVCFLVMATGNHYLLDAVAGAAVVSVAALAARQLGRLRPEAWAFSPGTAAAPEPPATAVSPL